MAKWLLSLVALAAAVGPLSAQAKTRPDPAAVAVVRKAVEAHGGAAALDKYKAGVQSIRGTTSYMGVDMAFTGSVTYALPDKFKLMMANELLGQKVNTVFTVNGRTVRATANGAPLAVPGEVRRAVRTNAVHQEVLQLTPLLDPAKFALKAEGDVSVRGAKAAVVVVSGPRLGEGKEWELAFDRATGRLAKVRRPGVGADGQEVDEEYVLEGYKVLGGLMTPTKVTVTHDGKKYMAYQVTAARYSEKGDPAAFGTDD